MTVYGKVLTALGRLDEATVAIAEALTSYKSQENHAAHANNLLNMAEIFITQDTPQSLERSRISLEEAKEVYRSIKPQHLAGIIHCERIEADVDLKLEQYEAARNRLEIALAMAKEVHGEDHNTTRFLQTRIDELPDPEKDE